MRPPSVPVDDRGLTLGVGLFETILVIDSVPQLWDAHVERLRRSSAHLSLPAPKVADLEMAAGAAIAKSDFVRGRAALRLMWTGGSGARGLADPADPAPRLLATIAPAPSPPHSMSLATARVRRNPSSPSSRLKTLSYLDSVIARREAIASGADEALLLDTHGRLSCAAAANLFWLEGERLCTPAPSCGALPGVVRGRLLARAPTLGYACAEVEATPNRLQSADGVFITNSLIGLVAAAALDKSEIKAPSSEVIEALTSVCR